MTPVFAFAAWIGVLADTCECPVLDDRPWIVFARPKRPRVKTIPALAVALNAGDDLICYRDGTVMAYVSTRSLRALLGRHVELNCLPRGGNSSWGNGYMGKIQEGFVPESLKDLARRLWIENDPKFELDEPPMVNCPGVRKP